MRRSIAILFLVACGMATMVAADKPKVIRDVRKTLFIELPTKDLVKNSAALERKLSELENVNLDITKGKRIEAGTKALVKGPNVAPVPVKADRSKVDIVELPTKELVRNTVQPKTAASSETSLANSSREKNPKVAPGSVRWHANINDACAASRKSGKPVMLFQMMGNLDDQFC